MRCLTTGPVKAWTWDWAACWRTSPPVGRWRNSCTCSERKRLPGSRASPGTAWTRGLSATLRTASMWAARWAWPPTRVSSLARSSRCSSGSLRTRRTLLWRLHEASDEVWVSYLGSHRRWNMKGTGNEVTSSVHRADFVASLDVQDRFAQHSSAARLSCLSHPHNANCFCRELTT